MNTTDLIEAGAELRRWRLGAALSLTEAGQRGSITPPVWLAWEQGRNRPSLLNALEIELLTGGRIAIEAWGYAGDVFALLRRFVKARVSRTRVAAPGAERA